MVRSPAARAGRARLPGVGWAGLAGVGWAGLAALGVLACALAGLGAASAAPAEADKAAALDTDPHLAAWWKFDDPSGTTAADSSRHGRHGTLQGGLTFDSGSSPGRAGKALRFDAKQGCVAVAGYKGIAGPAPRTVAAWIRTKASGGEVLSWGMPEFGRMWTFGFIRGRVGVTPKGGYLYMNEATNDDAWHHVAAAVDEAARPNLHDHVRLYLDGEPAKIHDIGLLDLWPLDTGTDQDVRIGSRFAGLIDEVRIYDRALAEEEVRALYRRDAGK